MTTPVLDGKPYAGNQHVRIDEGNGASAKPRRWASILGGGIVRGAVAPLLLLAATSASTAAAKTTKWIGAGGLLSDETKWSNGLPAEGVYDTVWVAGTVAGTVVTNDLQNLCAESLNITNEYSSASKTTLTGNPLKAKKVYSCSLGATIDNDIDMSANPSPGFYCWSGNYTLIVNGDVDCGIATTFYLGNQNADYCPFFYGRVTATNALLRGSGNHKGYFYGPVAFKAIHPAVFWTGGRFYFYDTVDVDKLTCGSGETFFYLNSSLVRPPLVTWDIASWGDYFGASGNNFYSSQTIDRIDTPNYPVKSNGSYVSGAMLMTAKSAMTLTLKATADATGYVLFQDAISLVYDPQGDYCQTFSNRVHTMTGTMTVKGGRMRIVGDATFAKMTGVSVSGGEFAFDSTGGSGALAALKSLALSGDGVFTLGANVAANPIGSALAAVAIDSNAKIAISNAITFAASGVLVGGVYVSSGTYAAVGKAGAGEIESAWIVGEGKVTVNNDGYTSWSAPVSGNWGDATKWTGGVPDGTKQIYVTAAGSDYSVTVDGDAMPTNLIHLGNLGAGTATLLAKNASFVMGRLIVDAGGRIEVPAGGVFDYSGTNGLGNSTYAASVSPSEGACPIMLKDGGEFLVSGGAATIRAYSGYFGVGGFGDANSTGSIRATAGTFSFARYNNLCRIVLNSGGSIDFSGTAKFVASTGAICGGNRDVDAGKRINFSGNAVLDCGGVFGGTKRTIYDISENVFSGLSAQPNSIKIGYANNWTFNYEDTYYFDTVVNVTNAALSVGNEPSAIACGDVAGGGVYTIQSVKGELNLLEGASLTVDGDTYRSYIPPGFNVGFAAFNYFATAGTDKVIRGTLNVDGGAFTNLQGYQTFGLGLRGYGGLNLKRGTVAVKSAKPDSKFLAAAGGGDAEINVSGGRLEVVPDAWIGGAWTNAVGQLANYPMVYNWGWKPDNHDSACTFTQTGGDVVFAGRVTVGSDGVGTIERLGSSGSFTVGSLILSNTVHNASRTSSILKFTFDEDGVAPIVVNGPLVIGENAKLVVDTAAYPKKGCSQWLVRAASVSGGFAEVTVSGAMGARARVLISDLGVKLAGSNGMVIGVR